MGQHDLIDAGPCAGLGRCREDLRILQDSKDLMPGWCAAYGLSGRFGVKGSGRLGQKQDMLIGAAGVAQDQNQQIDGLSVPGFVLDSFPADPDRNNKVIQIGQAGVGDGDTRRHPGADHALPILHRLQGLC